MLRMFRRKKEKKNKLLSLDEGEIDGDLIINIDCLKFLISGAEIEK